ncbi:MAG: single-stranded-DNA-specific exonuclease RecJ [Syntrophotaleaceae bacterium]
MNLKKVTGFRWEPRGEPAVALVGALAKSLGLSPLTATVLGQRGVRHEEEGRLFLEGRLDAIPDPFQMKDMTAAVDRLAKAIHKGEPIAVHGDYDVDGITGTALLVETLRRFGATVEFFIPLRLKDGYGLSGEALQRAAEAGARVAVSVDCGVSAQQEAKLAEELGLDLIITDHHQVPAELPRALAVVNPGRPDCPFPEKILSGVGVAFMLLIALRARLREQGFFAGRREPDLRRSLDLVALGTIADIVPLVGLNRLLVRYGLDLLCQGGRPGIEALKTVTALDRVSCGDVGFRLAPRLNAAGRLEDAAQGVALLLETSPERALEMARQLDRVNGERQAIEQQTLQEAIDMVDETCLSDRRTIVLASDGWHPGVIGIVASRLVERYHRPAVLVALENGLGKGSARSIKGFHLYRAMESCRSLLEGFGGHEFAAGLTIRDSSIEDFRAAFEALGRETLNEEQLEPRLFFDGEVQLEELNFEPVDELRRLAPFGAGNPQPVFVARGVLVQRPQVVGNGHIRFIALQGGYSCPCIGFGLGERVSALNGRLDLLFAPQINEWQGRRTVQLLVKDFRSAE